MQKGQEEAWGWGRHFPRYLLIIYIFCCLSTRSKGEKLMLMVIN